MAIPTKKLCGSCRWAVPSKSDRNLGYCYGAPPALGFYPKVRLDYMACKQHEDKIREQV